MINCNEKYEIITENELIPLMIFITIVTILCCFIAFIMLNYWGVV